MAFLFGFVYLCSMKALEFSLIIPVYNRPQEIKELLQSCIKLNKTPFEIVIIEDGSEDTSEAIANTFKDQLNISYYFKQNSGPGDSRNYGMQKAKGNYFIILDSDVILPSNYLDAISSFLEDNYYHCFGGPDAAHNSFNNLQKAINFAMTSFITTGGIRGSGKQVKDFQPRSFNMGLSKKAFEASKGFGNIHPGEDPDLSLRLKKLGFNTTLIPNAFVYHKRRISWSKFYTQVNKFGMVRPILNQWHPKSKSVVFWFPTLFSLGALISIILFICGIGLPLYLYLTYFTLAFLIALYNNKNMSVALMALLAVNIQFFGYGFGFLKSFLYVHILKKHPKETFPQLFFK